MSFQSGFMIIFGIALNHGQNVNATTDNAWVWVSKSSGSISCEKDTGTSLEEMGKRLQTARITIREKKKVHDSKMRAQVCGIETGQQNTFLIQKNDLQKAQKLGFAVQP